MKQLELSEMQLRTQSTEFYFDLRRTREQLAEFHAEKAGVQYVENQEERCARDRGACGPEPAPATLLIERRFSESLLRGAGGAGVLPTCTTL